MPTHRITDEEVREKYPGLLKIEMEEDIAYPRYLEIHGFPTWDRHMTNRYGLLWIAHPARHAYMTRGDTATGPMTAEEFKWLSHRSATGFLSSELERQARAIMDALSTPEAKRSYAVTLAQMWGLPYERFAPPGPVAPAPKPRTRRFRQQRNPDRYWDEPPL